MTEEIKIRHVPKDIKEKLKELAEVYGFPSLNSYLVYNLTKLVESEGLTQIELSMIESQNEVAKSLQKNTAAITKAIEVIYGRREK